MITRILEQSNCATLLPIVGRKETIKGPKKELSKPFLWLYDHESIVRDDQITKDYVLCNRLDYISNAFRVGIIYYFR